MVPVQIEKLRIFNSSFRVSLRAIQTDNRREALVSASGSAGNSAQKANLRRSSVVKTAEELARRDRGPVDVGVTICITDVESGKAVAYKGDGERFLGSKFTVKMVAVRFLYLSLRQG